MTSLYWNGFVENEIRLWNKACLVKKNIYIYIISMHYNICDGNDLRYYTLFSIYLIR